MRQKIHYWITYILGFNADWHMKMTFTQMKIAIIVPSVVQRWIRANNDG